MRLLLITDTHGRLDEINALARQTSADAVLHAGDFGFYDEESVHRLRERELMLRIVHSSLTEQQKKGALGLSRPQKIAFIEQHCPLSDLPEFLNGCKEFHTPVYAVWGNHEDNVVVEKFYRGEYQVKNLYVLHEKHTFHLDDCHVFGLGGNLLISRKLFQEPIAGGAGRVWTTFSQFVELLKTVEANSRPGECRCFVSHVSPGKEAFVTLIGAHARADFIISGHMGAPFCMLWNEFGVNDSGGSIDKVTRHLDEIISLAQSLGETTLDEVEPNLKQLRQMPSEMVNIGRGEKAPRWHRDMFYINLPDADVGYAILDHENGRTSISTHAIGTSYSA